MASSTPPPTALALSEVVRINAADNHEQTLDLDALAAQPVAAPDAVLQKYSWDKTADFWLHEIEKYAKQ